MQILKDRPAKPAQYSNCCYYYIDDVGLHEVGAPSCSCPPDPAEEVKPSSLALPLPLDFQPGDTLVLRNLQFAFDKAELLPASLPQLDSLAEFLQKHEDLKIHITGHTDSDGEASYNLKLSQNRAASVLEYLGSKGIARARMRSTGRGEEQPSAPNDSDAAKALNRRVEVEFLGE